MMRDRIDMCNKKNSNPILDDHVLEMVTGYAKCQRHIALCSTLDQGLALNCTVLL